MLFQFWPIDIVAPATHRSRKHRYHPHRRRALVPVFISPIDPCVANLVFNIVTLSTASSPTPSRGPFFLLCPISLFNYERDLEEIESQVVWSCEVHLFHKSVQTYNTLVLASSKASEIVNSTIQVGDQENVLNCVHVLITSSYLSTPWIDNLASSLR